MLSSLLFFVLHPFQLSHTIEIAEKCKDQRSEEILPNVTQSLDFNLDTRLQESTCLITALHSTTTSCERRRQCLFKDRLVV